jgi:hypothetical protein
MCVHLPPDVEQRALTLAGDYRATLHEMIGPPRLQFYAFDVRQSSVGPTIAIDGERATLVVGPNAAACESVLVANIAHEWVHLHVTDGSFGNASGLEEGFAVHFELSNVEQHFGILERQRHIAHLPATYAAALRDYELLLAIDDNPVIRVFDVHGRLTGLSWREMRQLFPNAGWWLTYRLTRRRLMRPR